MKLMKKETFRKVNRPAAVIAIGLTVITILAFIYALFTRNIPLIIGCMVVSGATSFFARWMGEHGARYK